MNPRTAVILFVIAALLGAAVWFEQRRGERGAYDLDRPLLELSLEHVRVVRIDNLERSLEMRLELDPDRGWNIVDPIEFPADPARMVNLIEMLRTNRATLQTRSDLKQLQLSPPRAVLEVTQELPSGPKRTRIELGALDIDGQHVYCRVDGVVLRTLRNLDTVLDRDLFDWRNQVIVSMSPQHVVEVHRSGMMELEGEVVDLRFDAVSDAAGWRSQAPFQSWIDPLPLGALVGGVCSLRANRFVEDTALGSGLFRWDEAELTIELIDVRGERTALDFLRGSGRDWLCRRQGSPQVYNVEQQDVLHLAMPSVGLIDMQFMRAVRDSVTAIRLQHAGRELTIERFAKIWRVSASVPGQPAVPRKADESLVLDLLGELERMRFLQLELELEAPDFSAAEGIHVEAQGARFGGLIGPLHTSSESGEEGVLFRREGDDVVLLADRRLLELAAMPLESLLDHQLLELPELAIARIAVSSGGTRRAFVRDSNTGRWSPSGLEREARELLGVIERLLSVRARRIRTASEAGRLTDPVEVTITPGGGLPERYVIGLDEAAQVEVFENDELQAELRAGLHQALLELVRGE